MKIQGESTPELEGIERLYLGGIVGDATCPSCGENTFVDFSSSCVLHPENGCTNEIEVQCESCEHRWLERFILHVIAYVKSLNPTTQKNQWDDESAPAQEKNMEIKEPKQNHWLRFLGRR